MSISWSTDDFKNTIIDSKDGNIESTTSQIEDKNVFFSFLFVKSVGNSCSGGLIEDSNNVETWDCSCIFGSLSLCVIEIGRDCNNCIFNLLSEISFCDFFHFCQNHCWYFFRCEHFGSNSFNIVYLNKWLSFLIDDIEWKVLFIILNVLISVFSSNESFNIIKSSGWVVGSVIFCRFSNKSFFICEWDDWRCDSISKFVWNNFNMPIFEYSNTWESGT